MCSIDQRRPSLSEFPFHGLWSLWAMLQSYLPIYQLALDLEALRSLAGLLKDASHSSDMARRALSRNLPLTYADLYSEVNHLNDSLSHELEKEAVFRIPPERKDYFEQDALFGPKVADAFRSCERDIRKAGSCYALGQEDACVHHLMLVLERGLTALATKVEVQFHYADWKKLSDLIEAKLKSGAVPRGPELDFYRDVNAQFGFLKEAYRKHSAHASDDFYDMPKALHIFNHVKEFMQALTKGGLSEKNE